MKNIIPGLAIFSSRLREFRFLSVLKVWDDQELIWELIAGWRLNAECDVGKKRNPEGPYGVLIYLISHPPHEISLMR